jgi:hypothetical protein
MKKLHLFLLIVFALSCSDKTAKNVIVIGTYSFEFPDDFKLIKEKGQDSYVGKIKSDSIIFEFDYGYYSDPLVQSQAEFLKDSFWLLHAGDQFMKEGITYDKNNSPKVEFINLRPATTKDRIKFSNADFIAVCKHDSLIFDYPVTIPDGTKQHFINVDTTQNYLRKAVIAKNPTKGLTGIYLKDLNSFNESINSYLALSLATSQLSKGQQDDVLRIFSTVRFVDKK